MKPVIQKNSRVFELMQDTGPVTKKVSQKIAKRLMLYCDKAAECNYDVDEIRKLRQEFSDVL